MNAPLITPLEVTRIAFAGTEVVDPALIPESLIVAAEEKYLRPVLGDEMLEAIRQGMYPDLMHQYLRIPLALYAKYLALPQLAAQAGSTGISGGPAPADTAAVARASKSIKSLALSLMRRAVDYIDTRLEDYPEYEAGENILKKTNIEGGIVL